MRRIGTGSGGRRRDLGGFEIVVVLYEFLLL